ncbi:NADP-binding protein [Dacryopinax primogenitus]|uniref:NADP-binding protein n=1 Tax=Dacryopinax primogenitus (strain DJM 731) TaxID=1858805 RepID=M5G039_DACPD|nr:NADP-binding protein [Dacryopinax primogenitus]EJU01520.1 NADP-binding protein [Dacryopinax primogenitus]
MTSLPAVAKEYRLPKYESIDDLTLGEAPVSQLGYGEVLLKVHAVSLNYRDLKIALNQYPLPLGQHIFPVSDAAGEIVQLGEGCKKFTLGDRVMPNFTRDHLTGGPTLSALLTAHGGAIDGFLREYAVVPEYCLVRVPEGWTYEEGASLPCAAVTAYNALMGLIPMKGGDTVLIQGTGGVSIFGLQIAVASGANVIITSSSDAKLELAKSLGAHAFINYRTHPDWEQEVLRLTDGEGVDYIVEVGGPGTLQKSFKCIKYSGIISSIGFVAEQGDPGNIAMLALARGVIFRGILIGSREQFEAMCKLFEVAGVHPVVDKVFKFDEAKEAYRYLESQKHVGKVVIRID